MVRSAVYINKKYIYIYIYHEMDHHGQNEPSTIQMLHWRMLTFRMLSSRSNLTKLLPQESEEAFAESTRPVGPEPIVIHGVITPINGRK